MSVTLLGSQRRTPTLPDVVAASGIDLAAAPLATVTAGWQEREDDDRDLVDALLGSTVNLRLYGRTEEIFRADPELAAAHASRGRRLQEIQAIYEVRLTYAMDAVYELSRRDDDSSLLADEIDSALHDVRAIDQRLLNANREVLAEFESVVCPAEREHVARHRREIAEILSGASGLAIAGGKVPTLLNRMRLLGPAGSVGELPVFAWGAGAMVVTDRIVVFHDDPPQGTAHSRVFEAGLGWVSGVVAFPHARHRLHLDDPLRVGLLARRFSPGVCVGLDDGAAHVVGGGYRVGEIGAGVLHLADDGSVARMAA